MCDNKCNSCSCEGSLPATITDDQLAEVEAARDLHGKIMNISHGANTNLLRAEEWLSYRAGHRDARHAAAELALAGDAEIERLRAALETSYRRLSAVRQERDTYKLNNARYEYIRNNCDVVMPDGMYVEDSSDIDKAMGGAK